LHDKDDTVRVFLVLAGACLIGVILTPFIKQDLKRSKNAGKDEDKSTPMVRTSLYVADRLSLRKS